MEKIAILTGGDSAEYNISLLSADTVLKNLDNTKYNSVIVHLKDKEYTMDNLKLNDSNFSYIKGNTKIKFDKIFIALHGPPAENGLIQDHFDNINIPYTSCNAKVSALTFDKFECNKRLNKLGFRCADSMVIFSNKKFSESKIIDKVGLPCFIKPNGSGSSYGITKVTEIANLSKAIKNAFSHDNKIIIESFIDGTEVSCGVYFDGNQINSLPITEIISENDFFDYEAKYEGKSQEITPARISNQLTSEIQKTTINIYKKMELSGICRVDFIIQNNIPYIIEINTIPGLSEKSIIPQQLRAANISLSEIFDLCLSNIN
jgi:D-alanine-D-alanine ligase